VTAQTAWIGVKAVAAAAMCLFGMNGVSRGRRAIVVAVLLLVAAQAFGDGLERLYVMIDRGAQSVPEVFLRLLYYGGLYGAAVTVLLRVSRALQDDARFWMSVAIACSVPGALVVLLSMFNTPSVMPPWRGLALMSASGGVTAMLLSVLTHVAGARPRS
jgi:hypothetical protein